MTQTPKDGDVVICFWYDEDTAFAGQVVGSGIYEDFGEQFPYLDIKRADGRIIMVSPGDAITYEEFSKLPPQPKGYTPLKRWPF